MFDTESSVPFGKNCHALLIDDNQEFCSLLKEYLATFSFETSCAYTGQDGVNVFRDLQQSGNPCDLIILDLFLPDMNGMEVLQRLRRQTDLPIIMLSAHNDETDRIITLEMGADDYVPKNFSTRELLARIRAVLRRRVTSTADSAPETSPECISVRNLCLDRQAMSATLEGRALDLTAMEFILLYTMALRPGHVFSREELMAATGDRNFSKFDRSIDVHISSLRRKLGEDSRMPRYLKTLRSAGYLIIK